MVLKDSGNAVKTVVKDVVMKECLAEGNEFSISLSERISADGTDYLLIPGAKTALSYASSNKFANAVKGINAYEITASKAKKGKIKYATGTAYDVDKPGLLYVPVKISGEESGHDEGVDEDPIEQPGDGNDGDTGEGPGDDPGGDPDADPGDGGSDPDNEDTVNINNKDYYANTNYLITFDNILNFSRI